MADDEGELPLRIGVPHRGHHGVVQRGHGGVGASGGGRFGDPGGVLENFSQRPDEGL
jgi:hypothetical protein